MAHDRHALQTRQLLTKTQAIEQAQAPPEDPVGRHHRTPPEMSENSVARGMPIMYVSCEPPRRVSRAVGHHRVPGCPRSLFLLANRTPSPRKGQASASQVLRTPSRHWTSAIRV